MHSSRMRTGRSLTVCRGCASFPGGGGMPPSGGDPSQGVASYLGGASFPGGCFLLRQVPPCWGGASFRVGVPPSWGVLPSRGWCCFLPGGCLLSGEMPPSQHALRQSPPCEQNDRQVQKYYLGHNFIAAGKNLNKDRYFLSKGNVVEMYSVIH